MQKKKIKKITLAAKVKFLIEWAEDETLARRALEKRLDAWEKRLNECQLPKNLDTLEIRVESLELSDKKELNDLQAKVCEMAEQLQRTVYWYAAGNVTVDVNGDPIPSKEAKDVPSENKVS